MSKEQHDFLKQGQVRYIRQKEAYREFHWYAVSEDDARKMPQAFLEAWTNKVNSKLQPLLKQQQELQEEIAEIKKELPEKQKQFKPVESKYKEIKNSRYSSFENLEAYKKAKETILEMDKMLDVLEIELAGIQEKLNSIEKYRKPQSLIDTLGYRAIPSQILEKLDQMYIEQMIEQKSVKARKKATLQICNREKDFCDLFSQWKSLNYEVSHLGLNLEGCEIALRDVEKVLANPTPNMVPPKVYQNKVTIYPVRAGW